MNTRIINTIDDMTEAFRLRYEVFVEEQGWEIGNINTKIETDHLDECSTHIACFDQGKIVGYVRVTDASKQILLKNDFEALMPQKIIAEIENNAFEITRLLVKKEYREDSSGCITYKVLLDGLYEFLMKNEKRYLITMCYCNLFRFMRKLGLEWTIYIGLAQKFGHDKQKTVAGLLDLTTIKYKPTS